MTSLLDFFSYDSYPQFSTIGFDPAEVNPMLDRGWGLSLSAVRSVSSNFCVMEQQSGPGAGSTGWTCLHRSRDRCGCGPTSPSPTALTCCSISAGGLPPWAMRSIGTA